MIEKFDFRATLKGTPHCDYIEVHCSLDSGHMRSFVSGKKHLMSRLTGIYEGKFMRHYGHPAC